jgi:hypothetical protein
MSDRKPSSLSVLKTLPEERQAEIFARCNLPAKDGGGYANVRRWLAEDGIKTSEAALSYWYTSWPLHIQKRQDESTTEELLGWLKENVQGITEEQLDELGQRTFSLLAIRDKDTDAFVKVRSARSKAALEKAKLALRQQAEARLAEQAKLSREKFEFDAAKAALAQAAQLKTISASKLSDVEKIDAARRALFGTLPEEPKEVAP